MPSKKGKGKGKRKKGSKKGGKKSKAPIDWAADPYFDEKRVMIYIEHTNECPIFQEKAQEFLDYLKSIFPEKIFQLVVNDNGKIEGRPGAFEITFSQNARTERIDLWSGIDKGPPRREKFPKNYQELLPQVERILKKIYIQTGPDRKSSESLIVLGAENDVEMNQDIIQHIQDVTEGDTTT